MTENDHILRRHAEFGGRYFDKITIIKYSPFRAGKCLHLCCILQITKVNPSVLIEKGAPYSRDYVYK